MRFLKPIRWNEGLFLRPHHLQQHDLYLESREVQRLRAFESHAWGLTRLEFREEPLDNFVLDAVSLQAVLPDGTLVDVPGNARLPSRSFEEHMTEAGQRLDVSIGVRRYEEQVPQTGSGGDGAAQTRFVSVQQEVYDLDAGRDPAPIEMLQYGLRFFLGDEPAHGFEVMPIARLERTGDRAKPVKLAADFAPPCLLLAASPVLHGIARSVVEKLAVVLRDIGTFRGGSNPDPLILYQALSGCMPVLKEMIQDGQVHPRRIYTEMARLAGALYYREQAKGRTAEEVPTYDHRTPAPVFEWLRERIFKLSEIVMRRPFERFEMARSEDRFALTLPPQAKQPGARFVLEVEADDAKPRVPVLIMGAKISSPDRLATLVDFALPGVPTERLAGHPPELGPGQTGDYFRLKSEHEEWATHVVPSGNLTVFIRSAPPDVKVNLIVLLART